MGVQTIKQGRAPAGSLHGESRQRRADVTTPVWTKELLMKQATPSVEKEHPRDVRVTATRGL